VIHRREIFTIQNVNKENLSNIEINNLQTKTVDVFRFLLRKYKEEDEVIRKVGKNC